MSERDNQGLDGMGEQQSPSPADAGTTNEDVAITGSGGTPGVERLGIRPSSGGVVGDPRAPASDDTTSGIAGAGDADSSSDGPAGTDTDTANTSATGLAGTGQGAAGDQSGMIGTRSGSDRSDVPSGGMGTGDVTSGAGQADASQEGANIQP